VGAAGSSLRKGGAVSRPAEWRRLRPVDQSWQSSYRRVRARGFVDDPLGQGIVAVSSAVLTAGSGVWFLLLGWATVGGWLLGLAAIETVVFTALVLRALKRDKAVKFWQERRQLRLDLEREEAYRKVLLWAHLELRHFQVNPPSRMRVEGALEKLGELAYRVLAPFHGDLAVLVLEENEKRCRIVSSTLSQGSRWQALRKDKNCELAGDLRERLDELADGHRVQLQFIGNTTFAASFAILHESDLSRAEDELLQYLYPILETVASSSAEAGAGEKQHHLRLVSDLKEQEQPPLDRQVGSR